VRSVVRELDSSRGEQLRRVVKWIGPPSLALVTLVLAAMQTYPMMYPGYDIWWHLDVINSVSHFKGHSYGRWHWIWNRLLQPNESSDVFEQALLIHRSQFALTVILIFSSSLLILATIFKNHKLPAWLTSGLSLVAVAYWLLMHGTSSSTAFGGEMSAVTLSWMNWYSVSHQISLPIYVFGAGLALYLLGGPKLGRQGKTLTAVGVVVSFVLVAVIHAAELPYFLFVLLVAGIVYKTRSQRDAFFVTVVGVLICLFTVFIATNIGYGRPDIVEKISSGNWTQIFASIISDGNLLVDGGMNRGETSWNGLYSLAFVVLLVSGLEAKIRFSDGAMLRGIICIAISGAMPALLYDRFGAGILAQITYPLLAWRFSFSSLLFVAPSVLGALIYLLVRLRPSNIAPLVLVVLIFGAYLQSSNKFEPARLNARGLIASTQPDIIRFGLKSDELTELTALKNWVMDGGESRMKCVDVFSSYYLHYYMKIRNICLPSAVLLAPTSIMYYTVRQGIDEVRKNCNCNYETTDKVNTEDGAPVVHWRPAFLRENVLSIAD
jgi:hypothetical protein